MMAFLMSALNVFRDQKYKQIRCKRCKKKKLINENSLATKICLECTAIKKEVSKGKIAKGFKKKNLFCSRCKKYRDHWVRFAIQECMSCKMRR